ncbi:MMPL family transporter [Nocardioides sp. GXZ039]|uniref:MMPL family transporter n=1 Tax=Nocardioides sp. GXZ039 TaxID=3136018 RepID=UPI0030F3A2D3
MTPPQHGSRTSRRLPHLVGPRLSWVVVLVAVLLSGLALASGITAEESENGVANVPTDAESVEAGRLADEIAGSDVVPAFVVVDRKGEPLTGEDRGVIEKLVGELAGISQEALGAEGGKSAEVFPIPAEDGAAFLIGVPLPAGDTDTVEPFVTDLRDALENAGLPDGLRAQVTGGPAFAVDLSQVFDGADIRLLAFTAAVVALLLLLTYRSPWLWLVPLAVVGVADRVALTVVAIGTKVLPFTTDGASVGITSVLVFGAGTNYALLLIARYREELRRHEDRYEAMRVAIDRAGPAILASGGTVMVALLCLGFADSPASRNIGLGGALGIFTALVYALLVLPAAMTVPGRRLFWPFVPRAGDDREHGGTWWKVAGLVTGRPVLVALGSVVVLVLLALPLFGLRAGLSETEQFRAEPESVGGQEVLGEHFPAGFSQPTTIVADASAAGEIRDAVSELSDVRAVEEGGDREGRALLNVTLTTEPASGAAFDAITEIRDAATAVDPDALVGGSDAEALDADEAAARDRLLIIPLVLLVVLGVLLFLLRSVVAAVVLVATVVATYAAAMGAGWLVFEHLFGFPALDLTIPLLSFLFLVALGVDYNIFLVTRAKEEAEVEAAEGHLDSGRAISVALAVTGGVITSAGILLAAVFAVLGVLPLITLTQIGVIVGIGVLLDTLLVRTLLVPALVTLLGRWFWWPGRLSRSHGPSEPRRDAESESANAGRP